MVSKGVCRIVHLRHFAVCSPTVDGGTTARGSDDGDQCQRGPFPPGPMRMGVRWYLTSPLRYRHGEAQMTECGVRLDQATIQRGVVQDSPLLAEVLHRRTRPMLGFKAFEATQATLTGIERMHRLKKKQLVIEARDEGLTAAELFDSLAA